MHRDQPDKRAGARKVTGAMSVTTLEETVISISERAATEVRQLLEQEGIPNGLLRVFVQGGGCSGLQYGMTIAEEVEAGDVEIEQYGIRILVDDVSMQYLRGSSIEFIEDEMGGGFKIDNPNAKGGCGCGSSFSAEDGAEGGGGCGSCSSCG
jgi:iron-sulfur cluster assembly accessory protein